MANDSFYTNQTFTFAEVEQIIRSAYTRSTVVDISANDGSSYERIAHGLVDAGLSELFNACDNRVKGEDASAIGVQAAMPLTSTTRRGGETTQSDRVAETPVLSSDIESIEAALAILVPLRMSAAMRDDAAAWRILNGATTHLYTQQVQLLTTEVGQ